MDATDTWGNLVSTNPLVTLQTDDPNAKPSATLNVSTRITNGGIALSGGGTMQLSAPNTYSGGTTLLGGTLIVSNTSALGTASSQAVPNAITFAGGTLALRNDNSAANFPQQLTTAPANSISVDLGPVTLGNTVACSFQMATANLGLALNVTGALGNLQRPLSFASSAWERGNRILRQSSKKDRRRC